MPQRSWVSHIIIPCPGMDRCEYYKPGETNHSQQHTISKVIYEDENTLSTACEKKFVRSGKFLDNLAPVPYNSKIDPPHLNACFNCWRFNHFTRDCFIKKWYTYCSNCGRRYVEVENCPRCAKAYCEYIEEQVHIRAKVELYGDEGRSDFHEKKKEMGYKLKISKIGFQDWNRAQNGDYWSNSFDEDSQTIFANNRKPAALVTLSNSDDSLAKYKDVQYTKQQLNDLIGIVDDLKSTNINEKDYSKVSLNCQIDINKREKSYDNCAESNAVATSRNICNPIEYKSLLKIEDKQKAVDASAFPSQLNNEDEDYDDIIIDEDEKSMIASETGDTLQKFLDLMDTIKKLPIEAQSVAVGCFVNSQKKKSQM